MPFFVLLVTFFGVINISAYANLEEHRACDSGAINICEKLGNDYLFGVNGKTKDPYIAAVAFTKACNGGRMRACFNLGYQYSNGQGIDRDPLLAATLYQTACNGNYWKACHNLGLAYENGEGVPVNTNAAKQFYSMACQGKFPKSCEFLKNLLEKEPEEPQGLRSYYFHNCHAGNGEACYQIGSWMQTGTQKIAQNVPQAGTYFKLACNYGLAHGCMSFGTITQQLNPNQQTSVDAVDAFTRACNGGLPEGCFQASRYYIGTTGIGTNVARAADLLNRACAMNHIPSCKKLDEIRTTLQNLDQ